MNMDGLAPSVSSAELYERLGTAVAPVVLDVRREEAFNKDSGLIIGALRRVPEEVDNWSGDLAAGRSVVAYCVHGHQVSQGVAASLCRAGINASYLEGGIARWREAGLPTRKKLGAIDQWVTREHPKIDRIAKSGPKRPPITVEGGHSHGDCGQQVIAA
jgi:rhodanese-related sulfurtransferase